MLTNLETRSTIDDPLDLFLGDRRTREAGPWLMLNMITSIDGATAIEGRSTGLGDEDDRAVFRAIRGLPDVIIVGASTVKAEDYHPVVLDERVQKRRLEKGQEPNPRLVIVTGRLSLDPGARVFSKPDHRPAVLTGPNPDPARANALSQVADLIRVEELDANGIVGGLGPAAVVLSEGGPSLNGQLVAAGLVDELNLTVAPLLASGDSSRIARGEAARPAVEMRLDRVLRGDRSLFLRFVRD